MEKILIKPSPKEIVLRGKPEDGHVDVFSYNYEGNASGALGSLFIVGHVQPATEDTSYMINLVASLAKREYYAQPDGAPKESFAKTLKKINEVLQDFFRNKEIKVDIGIFAITGENILISRLGKFKIILGRDNQNVDILNNINLFNKEHIQEKEFSNVISGKIIPKDRIFAFYPGRSIIAREKNIKSLLLKSEAEDFVQKLNTIKKDNTNFLCAGLHISIDKYTEQAIIETPQPQELRAQAPKAVLARVSKTSEKKSAPVEIPSMKPVEEKPVVDVRPEPTPEKVIPSQPDIKTEPTPDQGNVSYPGSGKNLYPNPSSSPSPASPSAEPESPLIRPSEFSSAKKENFLSIILKKYKPSGIYVIGSQPAISRKKLILTSVLILAIIGAGIVGKMTIFPSLPIPGMESQEDKIADALLERTRTELQTAQAYKDQNNLLEARKTIMESLASLESSNSEDEDLLAAKQQMSDLLDQIDKAVDGSPNLLYQIAQDLGNGSLLAFAKDKLLVYASSLNDSNSGTVFKTSESGIEETTAISNFNPIYLIGGEGLVVMLNSVADQIGSLVMKSGDLKTSSLALSGTVINAYPYQDNLYVLTSDGIYKITDAIQGKSTPANWLSEDVKLPVNPLLMAVDGNVYIMTESGSLVTYFRGEKKSEINTSIPVDSDSILLTTKDGTSLYLIDKEFGRIYVINKSSGSLEKTIKLNSDQPLVSASISDTGTIYLLTSDNKVWKVLP